MPNNSVIGEAEEIYKHNKWLVYGEALHQLREFGVTIKASALGYLFLVRMI